MPVLQPAGFEFRVVFILDRLPTKAREPSLHCYLIHREGRKIEYLCESERNKLGRETPSLVDIYPDLILTGYPYICGILKLVLHYHCSEYIRHLVFHVSQTKAGFVNKYH